MSVKKKAKKLPPNEDNIDEIINRGGKTTEESKQDQPNTRSHIRFTLRIPQLMLDKLDRKRKSRAGIVSRNQWIIEKIANHIEDTD